LERVQCEERLSVIDIGLSLLRQETVSGHIDPVVPDLLHH
jgi:hypothetical protein